MAAYVNDGQVQEVQKLCFGLIQIQIQIQIQIMDERKTKVESRSMGWATLTGWLPMKPGQNGDRTKLEKNQTVVSNHHHNCCFYQCIISF